jgi:hypothetical protein
LNGGNLMSNTVRPSTSLLPMDDIANELHVRYGFNTTVDKATDTLSVAGTDSDSIAIAAIGPEGLDDTEPRTTVRNAMNLGGVPASDYITGARASKIETFADNVSTIYADEITALRDEVYQLKGDLIRNGVIDNNDFYQGMYDTMDSSRPRCDFTEKGGIKGNVSAGAKKLYPEFVDEFEEGDFVVIHQEPLVSGDLPLNKVAKIIHKNESVDGTGAVVSDPGALVIDSDPGELDMTRTTLYKTLGLYNNGSFSFVDKQEHYITDKETYVTQNDDTDVAEMKQILINNTGYAVKFRIPKEAEGALSRFAIKVKSTFNRPGTLKCYVINASDVPNVKGIADAESKAIIIGSSGFVYPDDKTATSPSIVEFTNFTNSGKSVLLSNQDYVFIVVATDVEKPDPSVGTVGRYWSVAMIKRNLQLNYASYSFEQQTDGTVQLIPLADNEMYFVMSTKKVLNNEIVAYTEGVYTTELKLPKPIEVSRARLMMRIAREGLFVVTSSGNKPYASNTALNIAQDGALSTYVGRNRGLDTLNPFIIGNNVMMAKAVSPDQVTINNGLYLRQNDPIYRVGYEIHVRASYENYIETNGVMIKDPDERHKYVPLTLTAVMPDGPFKKDQALSDRLVFEGNFTDNVTNTPVYVNKFEVQVKWTSGYPESELNSVNPYTGQKNTELVGKITDLVLSFDKTL